MSEKEQSLKITKIPLLLYSKFNKEIVVFMVSNSRKLSRFSILYGSCALLILKVSHEVLLMNVSYESFLMKVSIKSFFGKVALDHPIPTRLYANKFNTSKENYHQQKHNYM